MVVTLRRSKGDQEGKGVVVGILRGKMTQSDPLFALRDWIAASGIQKGAPLLQRIAWSDRRVTGHLLTGEAVNQILKERSSAAGLDDLRITGHATTAAENGVPSDHPA